MDGESFSLRTVKMSVIHTKDESTTFQSFWVNRLITPVLCHYRDRILSIFPTTTLFLRLGLNSFYDNFITQSQSLLHRFLYKIGQNIQDKNSRSREIVSGGPSHFTFLPLE